MLLICNFFEDGPKVVIFCEKLPIPKIKLPIPPSRIKYVFINDKEFNVSLSMHYFKFIYNILDKKVLKKLPSFYIILKKLLHTESR